MMVVVLII